jgi:hypothetical protein
MAELASASVAHPIDPDSNLGIDRTYFLFLFVYHLNSSDNSSALFVNVFVY